MIFLPGLKIQFAKIGEGWHQSVHVEYMGLTMGRKSINAEIVKQPLKRARLERTLARRKKPLYPAKSFPLSINIQK